MGNIRIFWYQYRLYPVVMQAYLVQVFSNIFSEFCPLITCCSWYCVIDCGMVVEKNILDSFVWFKSFIAELRIFSWISITCSHSLISKHILVIEKKNIQGSYIILSNTYPIMDYLTNPLAVIGQKQKHFNLQTIPEVSLFKSCFLSLGFR